LENAGPNIPGCIDSPEIGIQKVAIRDTIESIKIFDGVNLNKA
jgi:hypothetical protein